MIPDEILRNGRILMVDDDVGGLCLLENVLNRLGFNQLRKLTRPARILAEFDAQQTDLVITDIEMPGVDGIELIERLRAHLSREAWLPILVLTGISDAQTKRRALLAGATDILIKPFDSSEILMRIRNLLQTRFQHLEIQSQNRLLEEKVEERTSELEQALQALRESQGQVVQQERFRAFGEMAGGVVHDFNNALMSVIGYSELLLEDEALLGDREVVRDYLKTMNTAGRDAAQVVSRLRDFYRPREESDVFSAVDLNALLEEIVPMTRPKWHDQAIQTGRTVTVLLELEKVPPVFGNGAELRAVITNLIFNAVDALPAGGTITLRSRPVGEGVQIEVADSGTGMTPEVRERCLEPFFSTKGEKGTGLGLAMSFGIIRRHEGAMEIDSEVGRGTTFRLRLPSHRREAPADEEARLTFDHALRVLVVDDDPKARDIVRQFLESDGHRVVAVAGGGEGMQRMVTEEFDVVITDLGMAEMTGAQFAEAVRRVAPGQPVILMTGFALQPEQRPTSVDLVLKKPLVRDELRSALREVLQPRAKGAVLIAA